MSLVPSIALTGIDALIAGYGDDPEEYLAAVGLTPEVLNRPDVMVAGQHLNDLLEYAARRLNQRYLGLQLAKIQGASILGPLWFLLRNSTTVREVLLNLVSNYSSHTDSSFFVLEEHAEGANLIYDIDPDIEGDHTQIIELGMGIASTFFRRYVLSKWQSGCVALRAPQPYHIKPLNEVFGPNLYFSQEVNYIALSRQELALPIRGASALTSHHYRHELNKLSDFDTRSALAQTKSIVHAGLLQHRCSLNSVAKSLNVNPRTLQHHLQQEGTSFNAILQEAKLNLALRYLKHSKLSITDIAQRLHFAEPAIFSRFIKRHTGRTPKDLRGQSPLNKAIN